MMCVIHPCRHNTSLTKLELACNQIGDAGAVAMGEGLKYDDRASMCASIVPDFSSWGKKQEEGGGGAFLTCGIGDSCCAFLFLSFSFSLTLSLSFFLSPWPLASF